MGGTLLNPNHACCVQAPALVGSPGDPNAYVEPWGQTLTDPGFVYDTLMLAVNTTAALGTTVSACGLRLGFGGHAWGHGEALLG